MLRMAIGNVGFTTISALEHSRTFEEGTLCVSRPDGTVVRSRNNERAVRGGTPRDTSRGDLTVDGGRSVAPGFFDTQQAGRYVFWWQTGQHKSNAIVFERGADRLTRLP